MVEEKRGERASIVLGKSVCGHRRLGREEEGGQLFHREARSQVGQRLDHHSGGSLTGDMTTRTGVFLEQRRATVRQHLEFRCRKP